MRILALQIPGTESAEVQDLRTALQQYDVFLDIVRAAVGKVRVGPLIAKPHLVALFAYGDWMLPLVEFAIDKDVPVVVFCRDLADWYRLSVAGLARYVDLYIFPSGQLRDQLNRNVNHVVVEDLEADVGVLAAMLQNILRHHKGRRPKVAVIRKKRTQTASKIRRLCKLALDEKPSFTELQYFLDGMHTGQERQVLIPNLSALLGNSATAREIRGLLTQPRGGHDGQPS